MSRPLQTNSFDRPSNLWKKKRTVYIRYDIYFNARNRLT